MRIGIYFIVVSLSMIVLQFSCDGFTKLIDEDYRDHKAKGVLFSVLTNTDERDTAFLSGDYYSSFVTENYKNRIYITNSVPPYFSGRSGDIYYQAELALKTHNMEIPLTFIQQNRPENIRNSFYAVEGEMVPGAVYHIRAAYDPENSKPEDYYFSKWSPVSATDTMPEVVEFELENAKLEYPKNDVSPSGGYVDVIVKDDSERNQSYQIAISVLLKYYDGRHSTTRLVHSQIEQPVENIDLEIFGPSRSDIFKRDEFTDNGKKRIRFSFNSQFGPYTKESSSVILVRLTTLSNHYAQFLKSSDQYVVNEDNPFAEPVEIYSNVENGYGIFALGSRSYGRIEVK
ncbi:DUF4249 domain-containing protein [Membranicola marinus]|uniref:DUF4249 domain-containing protein n=1 Tax=Membranihabitans marinus TaxID=1227546 RepID=A0A953HX84_9BACT|nr:DUF4249 family protein [Membranihabitans marinus]MBY5957422.1 DUF4249 domain-containing protein [Membranihabitans marinus]